MIDGRADAKSGAMRGTTPFAPPGRPAQLPTWATASVLGGGPAGFGAIPRALALLAVSGITRSHALTRAHEMSWWRRAAGISHLGWEWPSLAVGPRGLFSGQALASVSLAQSRCSRSSELRLGGSDAARPSSWGWTRVGSFTCRRGHARYYMSPLPPPISRSASGVTRGSFRRNCMNQDLVPQSRRRDLSRHNEQMTSHMARRAQLPPLGGYASSAHTTGRSQIVVLL